MQNFNQGYHVSNGYMGQNGQMGQMGQGYQQRPPRPDAEIFIEFDYDAGSPSYLLNLLCFCLNANLRVAKFSGEWSYQPTDVILLISRNANRALSRNVMVMNDNNYNQVLDFLRGFFNLP